MSSRYWAAIVGLWLTIPLAAVALICAVADEAPFAIRVWACIALFGLGWGMHRFQMAGDEEFRRKYPRYCEPPKAGK